MHTSMASIIRSRISFLSRMSVPFFRFVHRSLMVRGGILRGSGVKATTYHRSLGLQGIKDKGPKIKI
jgi:hypothetical protein